VGVWWCGLCGGMGGCGGVGVYGCGHVWTPTIFMFYVKKKLVGGAVVVS
jgi:hypothetical protein